MESLSPRLLALLSLVPEGIDGFADIGSDHALLARRILEEGKAGKGFAVENKEGPFLRTKEALCGLEGAFPLLGDGLLPLPEPAGLLILAGMGGGLIAKILLQGKERAGDASYLLLDPHGEEGKAFAACSSLGFAPLKEKIVLERGRFYRLTLLGKGEWEPRREDALLGPLLRKERPPLWEEYVLRKEGEVEAILRKEGIPSERKKELLGELRIYKEALGR